MLGTFITEWDEGLKENIILLDAHELDDQGKKIFKYVQPLGLLLFPFRSQQTALKFIYMIQQSMLLNTTNLMDG